VRIQIDRDPSGKVFEFPIRQAVDEVEGGFLEVNMAVQCSVGGKFFGYASPQVFVRSIPQRRPVIAFITDVDVKGDGNLFFTEARRFFKAAADEVVPDPPRPFALTEIFDKLRAGSGKWGEINIVTHANEEDWFIRARPNDKLGLTADDVERLASNSPLNPRPPELATLNKVVDGNTLVVLRGCQAGKNQPLLDAVARLFAGSVGGVTVLAPFFIQNYEHGSRSPLPNPKKGKKPPAAPTAAAQSREFFEENFDVVFPGNKKAPSLAQCKAEILKDPENAGKDLSQLRIHKMNPVEKTDPMLFDLQAANQTGLVNPTKDKQFEDFARSVSENGLPSDEDGFSDYHASQVVRDPKTKIVLRFTLTGFRRVVECRQPLLRKRLKADGTIELVAPVPDITNALDYGRSPALILTDQ
jgi:hypothetical protein